jgi:hypothetical protein
MHVMTIYCIYYKRKEGYLDIGAADSQENRGQRRGGVAGYWTDGNGISLCAGKTRDQLIRGNEGELLRRA